MLEQAARQPLQFADVEHFRGGRAAEGDAGEGQQRGQLSGAGGDQGHGLLAHVLLLGVVDQVQAGDDRADRTDEVVAETGGQPGGEVHRKHGVLFLRLH